MLARLVGAAGSSRFEHVVLPLLVGGPVTERVHAAGALTKPLEVEGVRNFLTAPIRLAARLRELKPDIVQGWLLQGNLAASIGTSLAFLSAPVLWNVRWTLYDVDSEKRSTRSLLRLSGGIAQHPKLIIYNSRLAVSQHADIGFPSSKARVIPNGFDTEYFRPDPGAREAVRRELGIASDALVVGMLARYHPVKDHAMSLRAAAYLAERRPNIVFVYAGNRVDEANKEIANIIETLGLAGRVHLLGERQDVSRLYASFDAYWMSSVAQGVTEGFPNVIAESMSCGVPCVATDVGDARTIIGSTGMVVESHDWRIFAQAVSDLLDSGASQLRRLGLEARERIVRDYSLGVIATAYEEVWDHVLSDSVRRS